MVPFTQAAFFVTKNNVIKRGLEQKKSRCKKIAANLPYVCHGTKAHDTHSAMRFRHVFATISRGQHPATHSVFLRRISLCDGELDCADVAGSA